jgi:hypothetical protein
MFNSNIIGQNVIRVVAFAYFDVSTTSLPIALQGNYE